MTTDTGTLFLALLAAAAELAVLTAAVLAIAGRWSLVAETVGPPALALAFLIALVSTLGSLWLSEGANFTPCRLCWYQRIAMYPMVPILGIAALRRDAGVRIYAAVLAGIGLVISAYHILVERFPN